MIKENKSFRDNQHTACRYRLFRESGSITMIADCKECGGKADLTDSSCLSGILTGLYNEYNVNSVILSHYIETMYTDDSMQMLRMMVDILQDFEQLSIREPYLEYFHKNVKLSSQFKNQQKSKCEKCPHKPGKIFMDLKGKFIVNLDDFYGSIISISKEVGANSNEYCSKCIDTTQSDLMYLFSKLENLRSFVIHKGYQIVI